MHNVARQLANSCQFPFTRRFGVCHGCGSVASHRLEKLNVLFCKIAGHRTLQVDHADGFSVRDEGHDQLALHLIAQESLIAGIDPHIGHIHGLRKHNSSTTHGSPLPTSQASDLYLRPNRLIAFSVLDYELFSIPAQDLPKLLID